MAFVVKVKVYLPGAKFMVGSVTGLWPRSDSCWIRTLLKGKVSVSARLSVSKFLGETGSQVPKELDGGHCG